MKNLLYIIVPIILVGAAIALFSRISATQNPNAFQPPVIRQDIPVKEKVYVALEEGGAIAVIDSFKKQVVANIDITEESNGIRVNYMPHNVQVAPDGKTVWVAANAMEMDKDEHAAADSDMEKIMGAASLDQVIVIDPATDRVIARIPTGSESHLAHVAVTPDSKTAYVTSQEKGEIYKINTTSYTIENKITIGADSGPHGLRISPDGTKAFIALVNGKALAVLDMRSDTVKKYPVNSGVVQTAVTPDGKYAFASLYSTKQIMRFDISSEKIITIDLPAEAKGPVQIYPTPDSRFLYVADQGYYFDQPTSTLVYRVDIEKSSIDQTIPAGAAPHGIVVDKNGTFAYLTNLLSNDVSVIDTALGKEVARIPAGKMPNGISVWNSVLGGTQ